MGDYLSCCNRIYLQEDSCCVMNDDVGVDLEKKYFEFKSTEAVQGKENVDRLFRKRTFTVVQTDSTHKVETNVCDSSSTSGDLDISSISNDLEEELSLDG